MDYLTMRQAADVAGVSVSTINRWARTGILRCGYPPGQPRRTWEGELRRAQFRVFVLKKTRPERMARRRQIKNEDDRIRALFWS